MENSIKAVVGGIAYVKFYFSPLCKALLIPVSAVVLLTLVGLMPSLSANGHKIIELLEWVPLTLIAITTHKIILEGPESVPSWGINRIKWREIKFFLYGLIIGLIMLPASFFLFVPYAGIFLFAFSAAYLMGRFSLVFPSIAIGGDVDLKDSWNATKNHKLMMFSAVVLFPVLIGVIEYFLVLIPGIGNVVSVFSVFTMIFIVAALSVAYKIAMGIDNAR